MNNATQGAPAAEPERFILSSVVIVSTGEYSDYSPVPYRVLKPFTFAEAEASFRGQWVSPNAWQTSPHADDFQSWLTTQGYIDDLPIHEVHIGGSYGEMSIEPDAAALQFAPAAEPTESASQPELREAAQRVLVELTLHGAASEAGYGPHSFPADLALLANYAIAQTVTPSQPEYTDAEIEAAARKTWPDVSGALGVGVLRTFLNHLQGRAK